MNNSIPKRTVVITGSTRGIGRGLAEAFLAMDCNVVISGRNQAGVNQALGEITPQFGSESVAGFACDVTAYEQISKLWDFGLARFGRVDIWVNNAGISLSTMLMWENSVEDMDQLVNVNIKGVLYGSKVAITGMLKQGGGHLYNMEGLGSDGRIIRGITTYGSSKSAVAYMTKALAREIAGSPIRVSALSPGMVVTDLLLRDLDVNSPKYADAIKIFNILADRVEVVAPWLAKKMLSRTKNGGGIRWLHTARIIWRFSTAPFSNRNVLDHRPQ